MAAELAVSAGAKTVPSLVVVPIMMGTSTKEPGRRGRRASRGVESRLCRGSSRIGVMGREDPGVPGMRRGCLRIVVGW